MNAPDAKLALTPQELPGRPAAETRDAWWQRLFASALDHARQGDDLAAAVAGSLELALDYTRLPLGHAFLLDDEGLLRPTLTWKHRGDRRFEEFVAATQQALLRVGEGLPGVSLGTGKATWIRDIAKAQNFPRRDAAVAAGIRSGVAVPIRSTRG